jgi:hypothetical protein
MAVMLVIQHRQIQMGWVALLLVATQTAIREMLMVAAEAVAQIYTPVISMLPVVAAVELLPKRPIRLAV